MNKKFSTLVAGLAMISAVASAQITKTDGYTMLKSSSSDYLAVYGAKSDSVVVKTFSNLATAPKASIEARGPYGYGTACCFQCRQFP